MAQAAYSRNNYSEFKEQQNSQTFKAIFLNAIMFFAVIYPSYQLLTGDRGIFVWFDLNQKNITLKADTENLSQTKQMIEEDVIRLSPKTFDIDYAEEIIQKKLPLFKQNSVVVVNYKPEDFLINKFKTNSAQK